jgi:S1-C subfamily serine protease
MLLRVAKVQTFMRGKRATNATGFFYLHEDFLYLVTARHVVCDEASQHYPEHLGISLHSSADDIRLSDDLLIPLHVNGVRQWHEFRSIDGPADVVAVMINDPDVLRTRFVVAFRSVDILGRGEPMPLGQDALILGFPLGFSDTLHNLPIVRRATIASSFSHPFKGKSYFLTDARLHRGMSGSPVIVRSAVASPEIFGQREFEWRLLGIHSSSLDVSDRDSIQDERLALNMTWYASLIPEMLPSPFVAK